MSAVPPGTDATDGGRAHGPARRRRQVVKWLVVAALLALALAFCRTSTYNGFHQYYPVANDPDVAVLSASAHVDGALGEAYTTRSRKRVTLRVVHLKTARELFYERFEVEGGAVNAVITWRGPRQVDIDLHEEGTPPGSLARRRIELPQWR